jgi:DNA repair exonuclease SbcCD ATPase subunit
MKFGNLQIDNFLTIGSASLSLADKGLVLVQGSNLDDPSAKSNGAGKSSIVDALCWVLYGETARGVSADAVINNKAKKNCSVLLQVINGKEVYQINRYRKHDEHKNLLSVTVDTAIGEWANITKGTDRETQVLVEQILGCSYEVFISAIYAGQEKMPDIPSMTDKQLKLLIEEAAGVTKLSQAYEVARSELLKQGTDLELAKSSQTTAIEAHKRNKDNLGFIKGKLEEFEVTRGEEVRSRRLTLLTNLKTLKGAIDVAAADTSLASTVEEHRLVNSQLDDIEKLKEPQRKLEAEVIEMEMKLAIVNSKSTDAVKHLEIAKTSLKNVTDRIGSNCSECGKPYTEHDMEAVTSASTSKVEEVTAMNAKIAVAEKALKACIADLKAQIDKLPTISFGELVERSRVLEEDIKRHKSVQENLKLLRSQADRDKEALTKVETSPNPHEAVLADFISKLDKEEESLAETAIKVDTLDKSLEIYRDTVKVFSPAGVRAHILDTVTPFLNDRTSHYLGILSDGNITAAWSTLSRTAKGEIREKFSIDVENDKGANSFTGMSGGEKRKVRLSCSLALQDLVSSRATKSIDMWIGDEVDAALDDAGLERLMSILNDKAKEKGTVLVISHNSLTDWIDNVSTITKNEGYSTVEGALCLAES